MARYRNVIGGEALRRVLRAGLSEANEVERVLAGFFDSAKYPDGTPVAAVAAWNEFGTGDIPERAFFRQALALAQPKVTALIRAEVNARTLKVDERLAGRIGALVVGEIQQRIVDLRSPPNSPSTIQRKKSSNPLVDTGTLRTAASWQIE